VAARHSGSPVNATALIRGMFHKVSHKPQPGMGVFPPEWLESTFMPAAVRKVTGTRALQAFSLQYGEPLGDSGLRRLLAQKLASLNIQTRSDHIITTVGATHALDIVSRTLLRAGDPVMVEEPGWAVEFARLAALGMRILPVPRGPDGPDLEVMARYCEVHQPKLYVSVSVFHNPTGHCLSPGSAHRLLQLANQHNFHIVEDDTYSHLAPEHATRLCALDGLQRTIYVSGFAKILAPGWRVGFMAAPPDLVERLLDTKLLGTLTTPALLEKALAWCIDQGQLRRHAERIRTRLDAARARSVKLALAHGCSFAAEPAGLFGWVETGVDTDALAQRMLDEGYLIAPGALFHAVRKPSTLMRINFATTQEAAFWKVFARLRDSMK
jgi:DNA-binding transcriptional MocR family regulator